MNTKYTTDDKTIIARFVRQYGRNIDEFTLQEYSKAYYIQEEAARNRIEVLLNSGKIRISSFNKEQEYTANIISSGPTSSLIKITFTTHNNCTLYSRVKYVFEQYKKNEKLARSVVIKLIPDYPATTFRDIQYKLINIINIHENRTVNLLSYNEFKNKLDMCVNNSSYNVDSSCFAVIVGNEHNYEIRRQYPKSSNLELRKSLILYYDLETVDVTKVYSVSYKWSNEEDIKNYIGENALEKFIAEIESKISKNTRITLIAYNGSGFDLWILLGVLKDKVKITKILLQNNRIYQLGGYFASSSTCVFSTWDPFLYFWESLESVSTEFGLGMKKEEFDHSYIQGLYDGNKNFGFLHGELESKIIEYNNKDIGILENVVQKMLETNPLLSHSITARSHAYDIWKETVKKQNILYTMEADEFAFIRSAILPERIIADTMKTEGEFTALSVSSIHINQLTNNNYYPIGPSEIVSKEVPGLLGIYKCIILYQRKPYILPDCEDNENIVLSTIMIDLLRVTYGHNCVKVCSGIVWNKKSKDVFTQFLEKYKHVDGDIVRNKISKHIVKSLPTKLLDNIYSTQAFTSNDFNKTYNTLKSDMKTNNYNYELVTHKFEIIRGESKSAPNYNNVVPQHLGVFLYDYTRRYLYDNIFKKLTVYYSDGDVVIISKEDAQSIKADIWIDDIHTLYIVSHKSYALVNNNDIKMKLKNTSIKTGLWKLKEDPLDDKPIPFNEKLYEELVKDKNNVKIYNMWGSTINAYLMAF